MKPIKLISQEVGIQIQPSPRFKFLADVWYTTLTQEIFQAATGLDRQNLGHSIREGYDIEGRYYVRQTNRARRPCSSTIPTFPDPHGSVASRLRAKRARLYRQDRQRCGCASVRGRFPSSCRGQLYVEFIGKKNLTEDGMITTNPYQRISSRLFDGHQSGWTGFVDMTWYPTDRLSETAINFGNPITATPADIFANPQAPVTLMVGEATASRPVDDKRRGRTSEGVKPIMRRGILACRPVLIFVSVLIAVSSASAHDVWMTVEQSPMGQMRALVHHGHPGDRKTPTRTNCLN